MSQPYQEAEYLIEKHGVVDALHIARQQLDSVHDDTAYWHSEAIYCYIKGYTQGFLKATRVLV